MTSDVHELCLVGVRDREARDGRAGDLAVIGLDVVLLDAVLDRLALLVERREVLAGVAPLVVRAQRALLVGLEVVGEQAHGDRCGTQLVTVIVVFPCLRHGNGGELGALLAVAVGDHEVLLKGRTLDFVVIIVGVVGVVVVRRLCIRLERLVRIGVAVAGLCILVAGLVIVGVIIVVGVVLI